MTLDPVPAGSDILCPGETLQLNGVAVCSPNCAQMSLSVRVVEPDLRQWVTLTVSPTTVPCGPFKTPVTVIVTILPGAPGGDPTIELEGAILGGESCGEVCISTASTTLAVAEVVAVEWVAFSSNDALDGDPNNGGNRIFPGKRSPTDGAPADRPKVQLKATISPIVPSGCTVHFRTWDVDDPFDQNNSGMPNVQVIDGNANGPDNRGTAGTLSAASPQTDADGEAQVTFTVSMQPGDNFRAAASLGQNALIAATQTQADTNMPPDAVKFSEMLTVWRKLHVETDSMAGVTGNEIDAPFTDIVGTGTALTEVLGLGLLDDGSKDLDDVPPENGRFENGTLIVGSASGAITISPITGNGNARVVFPVASIAGLAFSAIDNDFFGNGTMSGTITQVTKSGGNFVWTLSVTANNETPIDWPDFVGGDLSVGGGANVSIVAANATATTLTTSALNIPCIVRDDDLASGTNVPWPDRSVLPAAFKKAYVVPVEDAGISQGNLSFIANIAGDASVQVRVGWMFDAAAQEADARFWTVYLRGAFQHLVDGDLDPDSEGATLGIVDNINGQGANIYEEVLRAAEFSPFVNVAKGVTEAHTVAHEVGHLFNGLHSDGGLMSQTSIRTSPDFSAITLDKIRLIPHP